MLNEKELIDLVLASYKAEKGNDIAGNQKLLHADFKVTDMVLTDKGSYFPSLTGQPLQKLINIAFKTKGREFIFKKVIADAESQTVVVEFIESYPDPKTKKVYRTPQVSICEIKDGKIYRTRHYMDPRLSFEYLSQAEIDKAFE